MTTGFGLSDAESLLPCFVMLTAAVSANPSQPLRVSMYFICFLCPANASSYWLVQEPVVQVKIDSIPWFSWRGGRLLLYIMQAF